VEKSLDQIRSVEPRSFVPVAWNEIGKDSPNGGNAPRELSADPPKVATDFGCPQFRWLSPEKLRPHPILERYGIAATTAERNQILLQQDGAALQEPIYVTTDGIILDGYSQWKWASDAGRRLIVCVELSVTDEQQIEWLLRRNRRRKGWNLFARIMTALELEPKLRIQAQQNQIAAGENKGLSNLTKPAEMHVRSKLAELAGSCEAYIDYVKQLREEADASILQALEREEISIHWAWTLLKFLKSEQREILATKRAEKLNRIAYPRPRKPKPFPIDPSRMLHTLGLLVKRGVGKIESSYVRIPGKSVEIRLQLDEELFTSLQSQGRLEPS
jgi:hypothetical protein